MSEKKATTNKDDGKKGTDRVKWKGRFKEEIKRKRMSIIRMINT